MSFKVDETNAKSWIEDTFKKLNKNNGSVSDAFMSEMIKEDHSVPKNIKVIINVKEAIKAHKWLGQPELTDSLRFDVDDSRVWDSDTLEQDAMM